MESAFNDILRVERSPKFDPMEMSVNESSIPGTSLQEIPCTTKLVNIVLSGDDDNDPEAENFLDDSNEE